MAEKKTLQTVSIEQLLAEIEGCLVSIEEIELPKIEELLDRIRGNCQGAYRGIDELECRYVFSKDQ